MVLKIGPDLRVSNLHRSLQNIGAGTGTGTYGTVRYVKVPQLVSSIEQPVVYCTVGPIYFPFLFNPICRICKFRDYENV